MTAQIKGFQCIKIKVQNKIDGESFKFTIGILSGLNRQNFILFEDHTETKNKELRKRTRKAA